MSIMIKGAEMPQNCAECPCEQSGYCQALDGTRFGEYKSRPEWCPLEEVKEKADNCWIPVSERLPEKNGMYLISYERTEYGERSSRVKIEQFFAATQDFFIPWYDGGSTKIIAWQPLPEPYKEDNK